MTSLQNHVAVVTGASSGIGRAIALSIANQGGKVCLVARRGQELEAIKTSIKDNLSSVFLYPTDLSETESIHRLAAKLNDDFEHIDILVHSAGAYFRGPMAQASVADFEYQYRTNVLAPYALTQALLPRIKPKRGQIVFINSSAGLSASENLGQYAATKHSLRALADSLRQEVNRDGMRVLSVYLGRTATPMQQAVYEAEGKPYEPEKLMQPRDVATMIVGALGLPRTAEVTEIHMRPLTRPLSQGVSS